MDALAAKIPPKIPLKREIKEPPTIRMIKNQIIFHEISGLLSNFKKMNSLFSGSAIYPRSWLMKNGMIHSIPASITMKIGVIIA